MHCSPGSSPVAASRPRCRPRSPGRSRPAAPPGRGCVRCAARTARRHRARVDRARSGCSRHDRTGRVAHAATRRARGRRGTVGDRWRWRHADPGGSAVAARSELARVEAAAEAVANDLGRWPSGAGGVTRPRRRSSPPRSRWPAIRPSMDGVRERDGQRPRCDRAPSGGPGRPPRCSAASTTSCSPRGPPTFATSASGSRACSRACRTRPTLTPPAIVVADDLSPSMTATLPRDRILGIVLRLVADRPCRRSSRAPTGSRPWSACAAASRRSAPRPGGDARHRWRAARSSLTPGRRSRAGSRGRPARPGRPRRDRSAKPSAGPTSDGVEVTMLANIGTPAEAGRCRDARGPRRRAVPDGVPVPRTGRAAQPRTSRRRVPRSSRRSAASR